jgi:uncharacterized membrane protein
VAGVGFSLKKLALDRSIGGALRYYGTAGMISSGPWLISICTLLFVGLLGKTLVPDPAVITRFQVSVTWLFAFSLLFTAPITLYLTRFTSDLLYKKRDDYVLPVLTGAMAVTGGVALLACVGISFPFADTSLLVQVLLATGFILLCEIWLAVVVLTGLQEHTQVTRCFALGYGSTFAGTVALGRYGDAGLMAAFVLGHGVLLGTAMHAIANKMSAIVPVSFAMFKTRTRYVSLIAVGILYAVGSWADKLMFWLNPQTSHSVFGPFRASEVYDLPLFLAYLLIIPGMTVFLVRVETDYAEVHLAYFDAVEEGATLSRLEALHATLVIAARGALSSIFKAQAVTFGLCVATGSQVLRLFGLSTLHLPLFLIDAVGVSMQVFLLASLSLFFYLDRRSIVLRLVLLLSTLNVSGTWLSLKLGAAYYGYGFAVATSITAVVAVLLLNRAFGNLVRDTFMRTEPTF